MVNPFAKAAQRVAVLVDTQNVYHSAKHLYQRNVDFGRLVEHIVGERQLVRAFAYVIKSDLNEREVAFFDALLHKGIELRMKDLITFSSGEKKADWDVGLAIDAVRVASHVDAIILVTGDGDFIPLVEHLKSLGVLVEVAGFGQSTAAKLKEVADFYYDLAEAHREILLRK